MAQLKCFLKYNILDSFSGTQGQNNWYYMCVPQNTNSFENLNSYYSAYSYWESYYDKYAAIVILPPYPYGLGSGTHVLSLNPSVIEPWQEYLDTNNKRAVLIHPGVYDAALCWVAPYNCTVIVSADDWLQTNPKGDDDGALFIFQKNNTVLWDQVIKYDRVPFPTFTLNMFAGDKLYFRVNMITNNGYDHALWSPKIEGWFDVVPKYFNGTTWVESNIKYYEGSWL